MAACPLLCGAFSYATPFSQALHGYSYTTTGMRTNMLLGDLWKYYTHRHSHIDMVTTPNILREKLMNKAITVGLHAMGHHHLGWEEEEFSATWLRQVHVKRHKGLASSDEVHVRAPTSVVMKRVLEVLTIAALWSNCCNTQLFTRSHNNVRCLLYQQ